MRTTRIVQSTLIRATTFGWAEMEGRPEPVDFLYDTVCMPVFRLHSRHSPNAEHRQRFTASVLLPRKDA